MAAVQIQHPGLITQDDPVRPGALIQPEVERVPPVCVGDGANHGQAADPVEQIVADHQGRAAVLLLMACLLYTSDAADD